MRSPGELCKCLISTCSCLGFRIAGHIAKAMNIDGMSTEVACPA